MYKGIWIHPWDINEKAISKISSYGFTHASLAVRYIEERQNWPGPNIIFQNPEKRTYTSEENAIYWIPDRERYSHLPKELRPEPSKEIKGDIVKKFTELCEEYSLKKVFWFPVLKWEKAVRDNPSFGVVDIYGSHPAYKRIFLCPSNPSAKDALLTMIEELSERYDFDEFELDSLRYPEISITHGTPLLHLALSPCFCRHCRERALEYGLDLDAVKKVLHEIVEMHVDYLPASKFCRDRDYIEAMHFRFARELLENELLVRWIEFRELQLYELLKEIAKVIKNNNPKAKITADLRTPSDSWLLGQDYKKLCKILDGVKMMIYAKPFNKSICRIPYETRIARKYLKNKLLILGLASWPPTTPEDIEEQLKLALDSPIDGISFYSYGWTPEKNLLKIKELFERWKI